MCMMEFFFFAGVCTLKQSGTEFAVLFLETNDNTQDLELYISVPASNTGVSASITVLRPKYNPNEVDQHQIPRGTNQMVTLTNNLRLQGTGVEGKGIQITSDQDIVVQGVNREGGACGVFMAIPLSSLDMDYIVMTYYPTLWGAVFGVAAVEDGTDVYIELTRGRGVQVTFGGQQYSDGSIFSARLSRYQTIQVKARSDLSGTRIYSTRPIAVFGGNIRASSGIGNKQDHLTDQLPPVSTWGRRFITMNLPFGENTDLLKFVSKEEDTTININGMNPLVITNTNFEEREIASPFTYIESDKPILVGQFERDQASMTILPPIEQYSTYYTFTVPNIPGLTQHYLAIIVETT